MKDSGETDDEAKRRSRGVVVGRSGMRRQRGVQPVHVHVTYTMGADFGKQWRLRSAGMWVERSAEYYTEGTFLRVSGVHALLYTLLQRMQLPAEVRW